MGFAFDSDLRVALVKKDRPAWMAGKWNGVGGKVEPGEAPIEAMVREFEEETGLLTSPVEWQRFATLRHTAENGGSGCDIACFVAFLPAHELDRVRTVESEEVRVFGGDVLVRADLDLMDNMRWLLPMSLTLAESEVPALVELGVRA